MHRQIRLEEQPGGEAREASTFDCLLIGRMERRCLSIAFAVVQSVILVLKSGYDQRLEPQSKQMKGRSGTQLRA